MRCSGILDSWILLGAFSVILISYAVDVDFRSFPPISCLTLRLVRLLTRSCDFLSLPPSFLRNSTVPGRNSSNQVHTLHEKAMCIPRFPFSCSFISSRQAISYHGQHCFLILLIPGSLSGTWKFFFIYFRTLVDQISPSFLAGAISLSRIRRSLAPGFDNFIERV